MNAEFLRNPHPLQQTGKTLMTENVYNCFVLKSPKMPKYLFLSILLRLQHVNVGVSSQADSQVQREGSEVLKDSLWRVTTYHVLLQSHSSDYPQ